jgi:hypothetical protein
MKSSLYRAEFVSRLANVTAQWTLGSFAGRMEQRIYEDANQLCEVERFLSEPLTKPRRFASIQRSDPLVPNQIPAVVEPY